MNSRSDPDGLALSSAGRSMLRWITFLFGTCVTSAVAGLGLLGTVDVTARNWCLVLTALSATLLVSSFDAYETERPRPERDEDERVG